jgi:hypothetical protein
MLFLSLSLLQTGKKSWDQSPSLRTLRKPTDGNTESTYRRRGIRVFAELYFEDSALAH